MTAAKISTANRTARIVRKLSKRRKASNMQQGHRQHQGRQQRQEFTTRTLTTVGWSSRDNKNITDVTTDRRPALAEMPAQ